MNMKTIKELEDRIKALETRIAILELTVQSIRINPPGNPYFPVYPYGPLKVTDIVRIK
jgi:hypothetical protein